MLGGGCVCYIEAWDRAMMTGSLIAALWVMSVRVRGPVSSLAPEFWRVRILLWHSRIKFEAHFWQMHQATCASGVNPTAYGAGQVHIFAKMAR
jgi:hypothetical protein